MLADSKALTHEILLERLAKARAETDKLFALVKPEARYARPIAERHRIVFYLGHLEAFDLNLLERAFAKLKPFDRALDRLFAFGIDPIEPGGLPTDQPSDWPAYAQVERYARSVRKELDAALEDEAPTLLMNVAIEHRLMHAETLAYMLHQLPLEQKIPQSQPALAETKAPEFGLVEIPSGNAVLGLRRDSGQFGWDNEFEAHSVQVPAFAIDRYQVTNAQFLQFVQAGGYQHRGFWSGASWDWKAAQGIEHPALWKRDGGRWLYRGMFKEIPLPADWPVYVSHAEASAYCAWAGKRLPTEAEWHRAASAPAHGTAEDPDFQMMRWDPTPVNAHSAGNGWEWTATVFAPFAGFQAFPFYEGYSANFFDGMHYVLKGGSPRTDAFMLRPSFRNWFQPHYQYVYAGFRCAV
jgi:ergothioneine biosynthesis protein EgtB